MYEIINNWKIAQKAGAILPCPRCGHMSMKPSENALSRRADIDICNQCGIEEALEDANIKYSTAKTWIERKLRDEDQKEEFIKNWWLITNALGMPRLYKNADGDYEIEINRKTVLTQEDIDDIMCTALEGGITYWCGAADVVEEEYYGEYASEQISRGGTLRLCDNEDDKSYILDIRKFLTGFILSCKNGYGDGWFDENGNVDTCMIDGEAADIIVQYALFGKVVYG